MLPQLLDQLAGWLGDQQHGGRLRVDSLARAATSARRCTPPSARSPTPANARGGPGTPWTPRTSTPPTSPPYTTREGGWRAMTARTSNGAEALRADERWRGGGLPAAARAPGRPAARRRSRVADHRAGRRTDRGPVADRRDGTAARGRGRRRRNAAARRAAAVRLRCRRLMRSRTSTSPPSPAWTRNSSANWPRCASSTTPATCCWSASPAPARR